MPGAAASRVARRQYFHDEYLPGSDVDLFLYGLNEKQAEEDVAAQDVSKHAPVRARTPVPTAKRGAPNNWISGKWYHAVSCPAWSGRYIFQIRWRPGGTLKGASKGISFGAKGHSSEIISGKKADGAFEFTERSDKGFIAHYQGSIGPGTSVLSGTYRNTRSGTRCHFVMRRFRM